MVVLPLFLGLLASCTSSYQFVSQPPGAGTYLIKGSEKRFLGETPLEFSKSDLPTTDPFVISIEKDGYQRREVSILPTNQTHTTVRVSLLPTIAGTGDAGLVRLRHSLKLILDAQDKTARRNYVGALAVLAELEKAEPKLPETNVIRGSIYMLLKRTDEAKAEWRKALDLDPSLDAIKARLAALDQPPSKP
jgi:tetratricopeptide (TPR) repeat protein